MHLRALTFLAPGIPFEFFARVIDHIAAALSCSIQLQAETRHSGPMHGDHDPFAAGRADLGFLCSPSFLYLRAQPQPSVALVPAAFVFHDSRHVGRPIYYSDVIVRNDHAACRFEQLEGSIWGFNDECSRSGHFSAVQRLHELGRRDDFFSRQVRTGSHLASIEATIDRKIDAAAIDSVVLARVFRERPEAASQLRVLDSWGPFPIQPIVVRRGLDGLAERIGDVLRELDGSTPAGRALSLHGFDRCVAVDESAYANERAVLGALGQIPI